MGGRPIHWVALDKDRPAVLLTRAGVVPVRRALTVAPITARVRGLSVEVLVGREQGLDQDSVINVDNVQTVPSAAVGAFIGILTPVQERLLARAIRYAFDLEES
jgi:mRNA interferase MazF